jgi:signal transduction histidine kinase
MRVIASLRRSALDYLWIAFVAVNIAAMVAWPRWETVPFHLIWTSLTLLYGLRVWRPAPTAAVLVVFGLVSGGLISVDASEGTQDWGELFEVPLMSAMFLAMVWHARRRQDAIRALGELAEERATLLTSQERFLHDVSHELRTPVTIARGHLEQLQRAGREPSPEVSVALDELERMARIIERLLVVAKAERQDFGDLAEDVDVEQVLEEVLMRWAEVAPRVWRVGELATGTLRVDPDALRIALDALVENAVNHTESADVIEIRSHPRGDAVAIEVADEGCGVPPAVLGGIFDRFARADVARARAGGGVGLGLAIVDAIAKAHSGRCTVRSTPAGSVFTLVLPGFRPTHGNGRPGDQAKPATPGRRPPAETALARR